MYNLLKIGDSEINDFKIGTEQVDKIYLGTQLLWKKSNIYGWYVNPSISDSYQAVTYLEDATGKQPASMDSVNDIFDYGDWQNSFFMPKPCMLKSDGSVDYYLDENNYRWISGLSEHNLVVDKLLRSNIDSVGIIQSRGIPEDDMFELAIAPIEQGKSYSVAISESDGAIVMGFFYNYPTVNDASYNNSRIVVQSVHEYVFTAPITGYMVLRDKTVGSEEIVIQGDTKILSDISDSTYDGNAMVEWPTIYYKFETLEDKGYKQVEYIQSNGSPYIVTDIVGLNTITDYIECEASFGDLSLVNNASMVCGCATKDVDHWEAIIISNDGWDYGATVRNNHFLFCPNYSTGGAGTVKRMRVVTNNDYSSRLLLSLKTPVSTIKNISTGTIYSPSIRSGDPYDALSLPAVDYAQKARFSVFAAEYYDNIIGTYTYNVCKRTTSCYKVRIYRNNNLIHNLIPVERQSDNELGLYDTITDKFYTNASTGTFVKGNYVTENHGWFYCSDTKVDDSYNCWNNYDCYNNIIPHFYTPIYNTTISNNTMRSLSGIALTTANGSGTTTGRLELDSALANNTTPDIEWYSGVWSDRVLISALMVLISKSLNNQAIFGNGINTQANKESYITGTLNDKGLFYGSFADNASAVKIFGMENFYGCVGQRIAGLVGTDTGYAYKLTYGNIDGSNVNTYNDSGLGYKFIANQPTATSTLNWVDKMHFGDYGVLPISVSGGANTYWADSFWSGTNYAVIGRNDSNSDYATGSLSIDLTNSFSTASWNISGSLSCKPVLRLTNVDTANLRIHSENIIDYRPNGNSTVEVQLYVKNSSYLPAYNELTGRIILAGSTATSIDDEKIYMLDVDNEWKVMYEIEQN